MASKTIPARTIYVCDRCKCEESDEKVLKSWIALHGSITPVADLCGSCATLFFEFLRSGRP